jgi:hypothetical protein
MKKNQVPRPRAIAAMTQPIQTKARAARSLLRSEGMPIPDCLAGERLILLPASRQPWQMAPAQVPGWEGEPRNGLHD